jgi:hypothetical protein
MPIMKKLFLPLVLLVTAAVYWPVLATGKLSDDFNLLQIKTIASVFSNQGGWTMRFLGNLSIYADNFLYAGNLVGFHVTNLLLFGLGVVLLWMTAKALSGDVTIASLSAAIYAFHFANAGSVSWLSDRWTLLSSVFIIATVLLSIRFISGAGRGYLWAAVGTYVVALMTKESGVTALLISLSYVIIFRADDDYRALWKRTLPFMLPFILVTFV